jgi:integrase
MKHKRWVKMLKPVNQIAIGNNSALVEASGKDRNDSLEFWYKVYFTHAVTTSQTSQKVQVRDISLFIRFAEKEGVTTRPLWTPRLSRAFQDFLRKFLRSDGQRYWSDRTANRILAHIKTFAGWIHQLAPFPLGNPMQEIKLMPVGSSLDVDRALSSAERRRLLDAADLLPSVAGRSKDRRRNKRVDPVDRPMRKNARPWRNRAIVYTLIETGMRRAAVVNLNIEGIDWEQRLMAVIEKGGMTHSYPISDQGLQAIKIIRGVTLNKPPLKVVCRFRACHMFDQGHKRPRFFLGSNPDYRTPCPGTEPCHGEDFCRLDPDLQRVGGDNGHVCHFRKRYVIERCGIT